MQFLDIAGLLDRHSCPKQTWGNNRTLRVSNVLDRVCLKLFRKFFLSIFGCHLTVIVRCDRGT